MLFLVVYFADYITYELADFHKQVLGILQSDKIKNVVIESFRGSGKTTLVTMAYTIWAVLGKQQKKFILLLAQTEEQARQYLANIKRHLETNNLLGRDLGPFEEPNDEWRATSIVLPKYGARVTVASVEKHIRGLIHGSHRPDVIICDDLEDLNTVKNAEERKKLYDWLVGTIIPMGDLQTRLIVIGTNLHRDSLIAKLKSLISTRRMEGITRSYPIVDENGNPLWPGKFKTKDDVERLKANIPSESAWQREYMLHLIAEDDQVIKEEWLKRYEVIPDNSSQKHRDTVISVDPAFASDGDYTAIVCAEIYGYGKDTVIYISPHPINDKGLSANDMVQIIKNLVLTLRKDRQPRIFVEDVGAQKWLIEMLKNENLNAEGINPHGNDKRSRLALAGAFVQAGRVLFPVKGTENLETQLLGFGIEKYDDLADAFSMLVNKMMSEEYHGFTVPSLYYSQTPLPPKTGEEWRQLEKKHEAEEHWKDMNRRMGR